MIVKYSMYPQMAQQLSSWQLSELQMSFSQSFYLDSVELIICCPGIWTQTDVLSSHFAKGWNPELKDTVTAHSDNQHSISPPSGSAFNMSGEGASYFLQICSCSSCFSRFLQLYEVFSLSYLTLILVGFFFLNLILSYSLELFQMFNFKFFQFLYQLCEDNCSKNHALKNQKTKNSSLPFFRQ